MTSTGPIVVDDPTKVMVRRIVAYGIDLLVTLALTAALGAGIFMVASVEGTSGATSSGSNITTDSPTLRGCDAAQSIVVKERISDDLRGRPRYRNKTVTGKPDVCVEYGDGSVRYIEQKNPFTAWLMWSAVAASALNLVLLQGLVGASVGKLLLGLRVVRQDGSKLPLGWSLWRWVLLALDSMCCFLPGAILVFKNPGHRRLGDLGTDSFVVKQSAAGQPIRVPGVDRGRQTRVSP